MLSLFITLVWAQTVDTGLEVDSCEESCYESGQCTRQGKECVATAADCTDSWGCEREGRCTEQGGACVVGPGDCASAAVCEASGACTLRDGVCVVGSSAACAQSSGCTKSGDCGQSGDRCLPTEEAHCAGSTACTERGLCGYEAGRCVTTAESCGASTGCQERGSCTSFGYACGVKSEADCRQSQACSVDGKCTFASQMCQATNDADCAASSACSDEGACHFLESTYPEPEPVPKGSKAGVLGQLAQSGMLGLMGGDGHGPICGPASDADCAQSKACSDEGHCTVHQPSPDGFSREPTCDPDANHPFGGALEGAGLIGAGDGFMGIETGFGGLGEPGTGPGGGGTGEGLGGLGTIGLSSPEPEPRVDPVRVIGDRKPRAVRQSLREVRPEVKGCTKGEVAVAFDVSAKGKLSAIEVRSGAEGKEASCIERAVGKADLGKGGEGSVTWTVRASD